jgi:hypothetical protein
VTNYKLFSIIIFSSLISFINEIVGNHQCRFQRNRPSTDQLFCIHRYWRESGNVSYLYILRRPMTQ